MVFSVRIQQRCCRTIRRKYFGEFADGNQVRTVFYNLVIGTEKIYFGVHQVRQSIGVVLPPALGKTPFFRLAGAMPGNFRLSRMKQIDTKSLAFQQSRICRCLFVDAHQQGRGVIRQGRNRRRGHGVRNTLFVLEGDHTHAGRQATHTGFQAGR